MKKICMVSLIIAVALFIGAYADAAQTTYRCDSMADTYMDQAPANINLNFGTGTSIRIIPSTTGTVCRGLIRFNIPPFISASQIVSATAHLYCLRSATVTADFYACNLPPSGENWWEKNGTNLRDGTFYGATWKISGNYSAESFWASWDNSTKTGGGGDYDSSVVSSGTIGPTANTWNTIDLTTLVTGNLNKVRQNGILIKVQDESTSAFQRVSSREDTSHKPYLELVVDLELPATTYLCPTTSDVYLDHAWPDINFYYKTRVFVASEASIAKKKARGFWKFDIPTGITAGLIDTATMHVSGSIHATGGSGGDVYCYALNAPFAEETDTWNTLSGGNYDNSTAASGSIAATGGDWERTIDFSDLLINNLTKVKNNGMIMMFQNETANPQIFKSMASRECYDAEDFAAYLEISLFPDADEDGVPDAADNCPTVANPGQENSDGDLLGNACDNCWTVDNQDQLDIDGDCAVPPYASDPQCGDACDTCTDTDNDTFGNPGFPANTCPVDNCPLDANPGQEDAESDGVGDVCDNCPGTANGPLTGTCAKDVSGVIKGTGVTCTPGGTECSSGQSCQLDQEDMNGNGIGDVCECYADCNHDSKVNTTDLGIMKVEFFRTNCATIPCQADLNDDDRVNTSDLGIMKVEFFKTGCPTP